MAKIDISKLSGMNNVNESFLSDESVASPKIVLDADVDQDGTATRRAGYELYLALAGAHSLWACESCMLCAAAGKLYNLATGALVEVGTVSGPTDEIDGCLDYVLCKDKVNISNAYWRGVFDPSTNTVSDWGLDLPPGPVLTTGNGNLPAGTYNITMTTVSGDEISGNGPISPITLPDEGGITLLNRPSDAIVWATDANEPVFYLVGATDTITSIPTTEPLPSFGCGQPPNMTCLGYYFGRMWGAVGTTLYYSEPHQPNLFNLTRNKFRFNSAITIVAFVPTGVFVGMEDRTVFQAGTEPDKMEQSRAGAGSVRRTLAYANNVPYLADILGTPEKVFVDVPIWRTHEGIVAGNISGRLFNLTKDKLQMGRVDRGASLAHNIGGTFKFLTSSVAGAGETDTLTALKNGRLPVNDIAKRMLQNHAAMTDEFECEVWRNGELI